MSKMNNNLFDLTTDNAPLRQLNDTFLVKLISFETMSIPVSDVVVEQIEEIISEISGILNKAEDGLDFETDPQTIFNYEELILSMHKIFSRLLRVANDTLNPGIRRDSPQKEFDDFLKDKKKNAKYYRKVRDNIRKLKAEKKL